MSDCAEAVARLYTFLDRELSDEEVQEVHRHLAACPGCLRLFRFEERLKRLVRAQASAEHAPPSLHDAVLDCLRRGRRERPNPPAPFPAREGGAREGRGDSPPLVGEEPGERSGPGTL